MYVVQGDPHVQQEDVDHPMGEGQANKQKMNYGSYWKYNLDVLNLAVDVKEQWHTGDQKMASVTVYKTASQTRMGTWTMLSW